jgi:hypothetical protein
MKKVLFFLLLLVPVVAMAQTTEDIWQAPAWLEKGMAYIVSVPKVGPVFETILLWLGAVSSLLTVLSTAFVGVGKSLVFVLKSVKLQEASAVVEKYGKKIAPYLKYLSSYNVQKKDS